VTTVDPNVKQDTDETDGDKELSNLASPDTRAAGRWMAAGMPTERSKNFRQSVARLGRLLRPQRVALIVIVVLAVLGAIANVLGPRVLGRGTDVIVRGIFSGGINFARLHRVLWEAVALYGTSFVLTVITSWLIAGVVQKLMFRLRSMAEDKLNVLPLSYVDKQMRGDLLSRVTNDLDNLAQSLQQTMSQMLTSLLLLIGVTIMMFVILPLLAIIAMTTVPLSILGMRAIAKRARPRYMAQWGSTGALNGQIEETFTGHAIVKSFGRQRVV
jgi:ATP-binding cassette subfamily B protein